MSDNDRWPEVERVLDVVLELEGAEQAAATERECAGDAELRHLVERYLRAAAIVSPLDGSLEDHASELIAAAAARQIPAGTNVGDRIGAYVVDGVLGEGGMGTVFLAHRGDGQFDRQVALKILNRDLGDEVSHQRFDRERHILASLRHPHIGQLLDGGVTPQGAPYLVLDYVQGMPITDYCQQHGLGRGERVRLLLQACDGIHHAHRHGVVHRDLKPSNILVESGPDGEAAVSVLDFGIATHPEHLDVTLTGQVIGTPGYMAPEQALGKRDAVDRRCDVFALGVILYELLTGQRPFPGETPGDVLVQLFQGDPTPPRRHCPSLPADLETIVMTCLSQEPTARYASARALADDLRRYLDGLPVAARPVGPLTRLARRARRHPRVAAALALAAAAAILAAALAVRTTWSAAAEARAAHLFGQEVERINALLRHAHMAPLHDVRPQHEVVRQRMRWIEAERQRLGRLAEGPGDYALGRAYLSLGEHEAAREALDRAWQSGYREPHVASARGRALGALYQQELDKARAISDQELRTARIKEVETTFRDPAIEALRAGHASSIEVSQLTEALIALYDGRFDEVADKAGEALERAPWLYEAKLLAGDAARATARSARSAGDHDAALARFSVARELYAEAAAIGESDPATHLAVCSLAAEVMEVLFYDRGADVRPWFEVAQSSCGDSSVADPGSPDPHVKMSSAFVFLARQQVERGEDALPDLDQALAAGRRALAVTAENEQAHRVLGDAHLNRSDYLHRRGKDPVPDLEASIACFERAIELNPAAVNAYNGLGQAYLDRIRLDMDRGLDPEPTMAAAVVALEHALERLPTFTDAHSSLGSIHRLRGQHQLETGGDPRPALELAAASFRRAIASNPSYSFAYNNLGNVFSDRGQYELDHGIDPTASFDEALNCFRQASELNPEWAFPHLNSGLVRGLTAAYLVLSRGDPEPVLGYAAHDLERGIEMVGGHPLAYAELARVHLWSALDASLRGRPPTAALKRVEEALRRSLEIDPGSGLASYFQGQAALFAARYLLLSGASPQAELERARQALTRALDANPSDADTHVALARLELYRASWQRANGEDPGGALSIGLSAARQAVEINPDLGDAHAMVAHTLFARAELEGAAKRRSGSVAEAQRCLRHALSINPLLESRYGVTLEGGSTLSNPPY